jgi:hypothetical protein
VIVRDPIPINLWKAISEIMSRHIPDELSSRAEASSESDSESDNGVSILGAENSDFLSQ